jgi:hypothetical protein
MEAIQKELEREGKSDRTGDNTNGWPEGEV